MAILKPEISGKHHEKLLKNTNKQQSTKRNEYYKTKYKLSGSPVFTFSLPGGQFKHPQHTT